jgi:ATP-dependent Clp protease ATP-binding subunit ClpC
MFERYTEKARRVIFFALSEARQMASPAIETEHLLLGIAKEDPELLRSTIGAGLREAWLRERIPASRPTHEIKAGYQDLPLSNECKRVLAYAMEEAERLGHKHIGPEHLLLGLMREEGCTAARLLKLQGADLEEIRKKIGETYR